MQVEIRWEERKKTKQKIVLQSLIKGHCPWCPRSVLAKGSFLQSVIQSYLQSTTVPSQKLSFKLNFDLLSQLRDLKNKKSHAFASQCLSVSFMFLFHMEWDNLCWQNTKCVSIVPVYYSWSCLQLSPLRSKTFHSPRSNKTSSELQAQPPLPRRRSTGLDGPEAPGWP